MKKCKKCDRTLELFNFWRHGQAADGFQSNCIDCMSKSHSAWRGRMDAGYLARRSERNKASMDGCRGRDPLKQMFRSIKQRAQLAGLDFAIKVTDIEIPTHCPVLGIPLIFGSRRLPGLAGRDCRPSVDRIDNLKGYVIGNIVVVSYRANRLKSDATISEMEAIASFYRRLDEERNRHPAGSGDYLIQVVRGSRADDMPRVQFTAEEEERSMPEREPDARRPDLALSPLRAQRRGILQ